MPPKPHRLLVLLLLTVGAVGGIPAADATTRKDDSSLPAHATAGDSIVTRGDFPTSIRIPGTGMSLTVSGYAKLDFIHDFDSVGNHDQFKVNTIAIDGTPADDLDGQTTLHARESRIGLDLRNPKDRFRVYFEGDFFADNNAFRMRHAYGELGDLLAGQTWTTFMDISIRPRLVDYEGPEGEIFTRRGMIRLHHGFGDRISGAIAVEQPTAQIAVPTTLSGSVRSTLPELPAYLRWADTRNHVQLSGIVRPLRFDGTAGDPDESTVGWGVAASGKLMLGEANEFVGQFTVGEGIAGMLSGFNGLNLDATFTGAGELEPLSATGLVAGYARHFGKSVILDLAYSRAHLDAEPTQPATTIVDTQDVRANLWWKVHHMVDYAASVMWGRVEEESGASGEAVRFQLAAKYSLN